MALHAGSSSEASSTSTSKAHLQESHAGYAHSPGTGIKHCCVCGADVAGRKRYKDHDGRYWCEECKAAGREPGDGIPCADCHLATPPADLVEHGAMRLCKACDTKRKHAEKREKARIAAALEEARQEERHRKHLKIAAGVAIVLALAGGAYALL